MSTQRPVLASAPHTSHGTSTVALMAVGTVTTVDVNVVLQIEPNQLSAQPTNLSIPTSATAFATKLLLAKVERLLTKKPALVGAQRNHWTSTVVCTVDGIAAAVHAFAMPKVKNWRTVRTFKHLMTLLVFATACVSGLPRKHVRATLPSTGTPALVTARAGCHGT